MNAPRLEFAFAVEVLLGPTSRVGNGEGDVLEFVPILGGTVSGPRLSGEVLSGGGDWSVRRGREVIELDARYLLRADDGAFIDVVNRGYFCASPEVEQRAVSGEPVAESDYYFRTSPFFRTDARAHRWLARHVFIGLATVLSGEAISIGFFTVL